MIRKAPALFAMIASLVASGAMAQGPELATGAGPQSTDAPAFCPAPMQKPMSMPMDAPSAYEVRASSFSAPAPKTTDFERRQALFEATMPGAPSLDDTSGSSSAPQYEARSATNVFPYSENATGLGPSGRLALYHVGVGTVGTDVVTHPQSVGIPPTFEYNIPHLPQEEPLWCWAAAAQQAIGWVNKGYAPTQCAIVALAHGMDVQTCCGDREGVCAKTGEIPAIGRLIQLFGGQAYEMATVPRDPKEIYRIVQGGSTLLIRLRPQPHDAAVGIRHMIVVRGIEWTPLPNGKLGANLLYNDPLGSGYRSVSFPSIVGFFEQALMVRRSS